MRYLIVPVPHLLIGAGVSFIVGLAFRDAVRAIATVIRRAVFRCTVCSSGPSSSFSLGDVAAPNKVKCFLMIHHIAKHRNVGSLVRCAAAFGVTEILFVGARKRSEFSFFGANGSERRVPMRFFCYVRDAREYLRAQTPEVEMVGIEIVSSATRVDDPKAFFPQATHKKSICLLPGNEGIGLTADEKGLCDRFVYVAQFSGGIACLNVACATSVVLHTLATSVNAIEQVRGDADKFVMDAKRASGAGVVASCRRLVPSNAREVEGDDNELIGDLFSEKR